MSAFAPPEKRKERHRELIAAWRKRNRERVLATRAAWRERNREKVRAYDRALRAKAKHANDTRAHGDSAVSGEGER